MDNVVQTNKGQDSLEKTQEQLDQLLQSTNQQSITRCCFILQVKIEKLHAYVEEHQRVWNEMRDALSASGWRNYSLFLDPAVGMIVGYFEADNTVAAQEAIARTEINTQWQSFMQQYFVQPDGGTNRVLHQYFYLA